MQIYKTNGVIEIKSINPDDNQLVVIQEALGGFFEVIKHLDNGSVIIANEEGKILNLPKNPYFTNLVGNVVVLEPEEWDK